jgi:ATP-dependent helicase STH1/SNF2
MKLVSEAKNDRLRHLLSQTDAYLETLANAVKEQQNSVGSSSEQMMRNNDIEEEEDVSAIESSILEIY